MVLSYRGNEGVLFLGQYAEALIISNTIRNNRVSSGGGISCNTASPMIIGNIIEQNTASNLGGGLYFYHYSVYEYPEYVNNLIANNTALKGGGVFRENPPR